VRVDRLEVQILVRIEEASFDPARLLNPV